MTRLTTVLLLAVSLGLAAQSGAASAAGRRPVIRRVRPSWPQDLHHALESVPANQHISLSLAWQPTYYRASAFNGGSRRDDTAVKDVTRFAEMRGVTFTLGRMATLEGPKSAVLEVRNYMQSRYAKYNAHLKSFNGGYIFGAPILDILGEAPAD
jgi:hypothetical protein